MNKYSTIEEYKKLAEDNNVPLIPEAMLEMRARFSKAFVDINNGIVVAVVRKDGSFALTEDMEKTLSNIKPLTMKETNSALKLDYEVDDLLDKINEKGIDSKTGKVIVEIDEKYFRPTEVDQLLGDYSKANKVLGWQPKYTVEQLCQEMVQYDYDRFSNSIK